MHEQLCHWKLLIGRTSQQGFIINTGKSNFPIPAIEGKDQVGANFGIVGKIKIIS